MKYKVSVIVPIYNVENYLERCLKSLVSQTLDEIQIILVNDGSPDDSQLIIDKYVDLYPRKVMGLNKSNGGLSDARNYGISYAEGEYIGFVDSDDYIDSTMYEKLYNKAKETNSDIVTCGYYGIDEETDSYRYFQRGNVIQYGMNIHENPKLLYTNAPYAWNKIYKRTLFLDTGIRFPKGKIYEDIATIYPLMLYANKISKVDEALYYYVLKREGAITATFSDKILQMYDSLGIMNDIYIKAGKFEEFKDVLGFINLKHTMLRFRDFSLYNNKKLQYRIVNEGFSHLNKYFDDWRDNSLFFDFYVPKKKVEQFMLKCKLRWYIDILIPNCFMNLRQKVDKIYKKIVRVFRNKIYFNKYHYVKYWQNYNVKEYQVLFESFHGTTLNDSPFAMMRELAKDEKFHIFYTSKKELLDEHQKVLDKYNLNRVHLVPINTRQYQKILATSKYLINNVSFPPYFIKRDEQVYLNTWHGTPLKTLGKRMVKGIQDMSNMQRNFLQSSYLLHPNQYTMCHMMEDYNLNNLYTGKVILSGYPRNSIFLDKNAAKVVREMYHMEDKEVFAYMPTWRGNMSSCANQEGYQEEITAILEKFDEALNENQIMYVNLHPLIRCKTTVENYKHIKAFPEDIDSYSFLNAVDILITDYSSVFFDFSITKKPIVLYMYDYDIYMAERGVYMNVKELPFEKIYNIDNMVAYLKNEKKRDDTNTKEYIDYYNKFNSYDKADNVEKVNQLIFYEEKNDLEIYDYSQNSLKKNIVYLVNKIKHEDDYTKLMNTLEELKNPIAVFLRRDFTSHTLEILNQTCCEHIDYTVVDTHMFVSLGENIRLFFARKNKKYICDDLFLTELCRILPNLKIEKVIAEGEAYRSKAIKHAVENKEKESL